MAYGPIKVLLLKLAMLIFGQKNTELSNTSTCFGWALHIYNIILSTCTLFSNFHLLKCSSTCHDTATELYNQPSYSKINFQDL